MIITGIHDYSINLYHPRIVELIFPSTQIEWKLRLNNNEYLISSNNDFLLNQSHTIKSMSNENFVKSIQLEAQMQTSRNNVSPIIDINKIASILVRNDINSTKNIELLRYIEKNTQSLPFYKLVTTTEPHDLVSKNSILINNIYSIEVIDVFNETQFFVHVNDSIAAGDFINNGSIEVENVEIIESMKTRYFTKPIELSLAAEDLLIYFDAKIPIGSSVHVFYKVQHIDDPRSFDQLHWNWITQVQSNNNQMTEYSITPTIEDRVTNINSPDFNVIRYDDTYVGFIKYGIKLVLMAENSSIIPVVRNLRGIALML
jgi:hypothetical protein